MDDSLGQNSFSQGINQRRRRRVPVLLGGEAAAQQDASAG